MYIVLGTVSFVKPPWHWRGEFCEEVAAYPTALPALLNAVALQVSAKLGEIKLMKAINLRLQLTIITMGEHGLPKRDLEERLKEIEAQPVPRICWEKHPYTQVEPEGK
jgi:hypothetical protein